MQSLREFIVNFRDRGHQQLQKKVDDLDKKVKSPREFGLSSKQAKIALAGVATAVAAASAAVYAGFKLMADYSDKAENAMLGAQRAAGLSIETYQTMGYAAKQNGFAIADLEKTMQRLNKTAREQGDMRSAEELFREFADSLAAIEDDGERAAFALDKGGRSAVGMMPFLRQGARGVDELRTRLGAAVIDADGLARALKFQDVRNRFNEVFDGIKNKLAVGLLTALDDETSNLHNLLNDVANMDFQPLINGLTSVVKGAIAVAKRIAQIFSIIERYDRYTREHLDMASDRRERAARELWEDKGDQLDFSKVGTPQENLRNRGVQQLFGGYVKQSNAELMEFMGTEFGKLKYAEHLVNQTLGGSIAPDVIKDLRKMVEDPKDMRNREEALKLLRQIAVNHPGTWLPEPQKGEPGSPGTSGSGGGTPPPKRQAPATGTQRTAPNYTDPLLQTVMHFKNEFIVFASRVLRAQGYYSGAPAPAAAGAGTVNVEVNVSVAGSNASANDIAVATGGAVLQELRRMHEGTLRALETHRSGVTTALNRLVVPEVSIQTGPSPDPDSRGGL